MGIKWAKFDEKNAATIHMPGLGEALKQLNAMTPGRGKPVSTEVVGFNEYGWRRVKFTFADGTSRVALFGPDAWQALGEIAKEPQDER